MPAKGYAARDGLARAGRIGKLLEKQGQLRPGDILVRAETGQIVHAGARFESER